MAPVAGQWVDDPIHEGGWVDDSAPVDHKARLAALKGAKGVGSGYDNQGEGNFGDVVEEVKQQGPTMGEFAGQVAGAPWRVAKGILASPLNAGVDIAAAAQGVTGAPLPDWLQKRVDEKGQEHSAAYNEAERNPNIIQKGLRYTQASGIPAVAPIAGAIADVIQPTTAAVSEGRAPTHKEQLDSVRTTADTAAAIALPEVAGKAKSVAADALKATGEKLSLKISPQIGRNLIKPRNSAMKFGADPGEFVVGMKTVPGEGVGSLAPQIEAKLADLQIKADDIAQNTVEGRTVPIDYEGSIRASFQKQIGAAQMRGNTALAERLRIVEKNELGALNEKTGGQGQAPAAVGREYQQDLGSRIKKFQADPTEGTIDTALQDAWVDIKKKTDTAVPSLKPVNQQIHSGIEAAKAVDERALTDSKADPLSFHQFVAGNLTGPAVRTRIAAGLRKLAPAEALPEPPLIQGPKAPPGAQIGATPPPKAPPPSGPSNVVDWSKPPDPAFWKAMADKIINDKTAEGKPVFQDTDFDKLAREAVAEQKKRAPNAGNSMGEYGQRLTDHETHLLALKIAEELKKANPAGYVEDVLSVRRK